MYRYVATRIIAMIPLLLLASVGIFLMIHLVPGDPVVTVTGLDASPEQMARVRSELGFDQPLPVQYIEWLGRVLTGDLGTSIVSQSPTTSLIGNRMPATIQLTLATMTIGLVAGIPLGVVGRQSRGLMAGQIRCQLRRRQPCSPHILDRNPLHPLVRDHARMGAHRIKLRAILEGSRRRVPVDDRSRFHARFLRLWNHRSVRSGING